MPLARIVLVAGLLCAAVPLYCLARSLTPPPRSDLDIKLNGALDPAHPRTEVQRRINAAYARRWRFRALKSSLPGVALLAAWLGLRRAASAGRARPRTTP